MPIQSPLLKPLLILGLCAMLAACSRGLDLKLDASSDVALSNSLANMSKSASPADMMALESALRVLSVSNMSIGYEGGLVGALEKLEKQPVSALRDRFEAAAQGQSGRAIIEAARKRKKDQAARDLAMIEPELAKLARLGNEREAGKGVLEQIVIQLPRFAYQPTQTGKMAMLEFKVTNNTEKKLTSLLLRGSAIDPATQLALFVDDINYKLPAGLAPGETKEVRLPYSQPGKWNAPELAKRSDIELGLEVVNADISPGVTLVAQFSHKDAQRLAELQRWKPILESMAKGQ